MGRRIVGSLVLLCVVAISLPAQAQVITAVAHRNTDTDALEAPQIAPNPLEEDALVFVDRTHQYNDIPASLLGAEYIMLANDNKNMGTYELDVTVSESCTICVLVDNRMGGAAGGKGVAPVITGMPWLTTLGFADSGEDIGIDESGDGDIDQYSSVFTVAMKPGTITLGGCTEGHTGNMLGVAVIAPRLKASKPTPADQEEGVTLPLLQWTAGQTAVFHKVYVGTTPELTAADLVGPRVMITSYYFARMAPGQTYYWRVDEVEADLKTVHTGNVWSFTAASLAAWKPVPPDGVKWVDPNVSLSWQLGKDAFSHDVYFGTDRAAVEAGDPGVFHENVFVPPWKPSSLLAPETTYYWRVDEIASDGTLTMGSVWSFTTLPVIEIA
ncbi:MAG: hypothetical protein JW955_16090, partial [Sedimentisphaerales bacterium]|nr:hypothetical protein [Sedimentisphaerales bacterium]